MVVKRDDRIPITHRLPDSDIVQLITWGFVVEQLKYVIEPIITSETKINESLMKIENKIDFWLSEDNK